MEQTIEMLKEKARQSWDGDVGEKRASELESYLRRKLDEYSNALNLPQKELLEAWEKDRTYSAINYYQEANQPSINAESVKVFDTVDELLKAVGDKKFRCPACDGVSTNPYECNSGVEREDDKICDWKVYGLFGDLGKGTYVFIKEKLKGETIFTPVSWEEVVA